MLRPERIAEADRAAKQIMLLTRPLGYLDAARGRMLPDGRVPGGPPARGGILATGKMLLQEETPRGAGRIQRRTPGRAQPECG